MRIFIKKSYKELSEVTASILLEKFYNDKRMNLSITAGASPMGAYEIVTKKISENIQDFGHVHFYNFDEIECRKSKKRMSLSALEKDFYLPAGIKKENIHALTLANRSEIQAELNNNGYLDFMLIGLGQDGHFCGNMPGTCEFDKEIYPVPFHENVPWYSGYAAAFADPDDIPEAFVTMGAAAVMKTKHVVLIVNGKKKSQAVRRLLTEEISTAFPATVLRMHPNFTLILDEEAASEL